MNTTINCAYSSFSKKVQSKSINRYYMWPWRFLYHPYAKKHDSSSVTTVIYSPQPGQLAGVARARGAFDIMGGGTDMLE
jgi:hypothetical protein